MTENKRRIPTQGRARASYEAILQATLQILESDGEKKLTTNLIAERAGVSIGTLYQYFADKDEILAELGHREAEAIRTKIAGIVSKTSDRTTVRAIVRTLMEGNADPAGQRSLLSDALLRVRGESVLSEQHIAFMQSISGLHPERPALSPESAFILTHGAICLLRAANAEPELGLNRTNLEHELVRLMESYLGVLARD